jgi:hypothetical protein
MNMRPALLCLALSMACRLQAAPPSSVDRVEFRSGKVLVWPGGETLVAPNDARLPHNIVVLTNGAFTVAGSKPRSLAEGDVLDSAGMLTRADGAVAPVMDHVAYQRGRVVVVKDGAGGEARQPVTLGDGARIDPDGRLTPASGSARRLLDGELFLLDGTAVPTRDTILLRDGRVRVQKDGSAMMLAAGASLMMNDGTKVFGDGRIVRPNGETITLREGQIFPVPGVATRAR